ncbi:EamA family transporter RarD [Limisalsivibrio acetivorans]|uniref:EamA family transporter RarD n=1 Tax=Limisalsivibrio acetivorans TaxID=1304888 RepID=UPI0003B7A80E|nr:EamA family transporter RarD [Limisalsivibrio acetivorans]
MRSDTAGAGFLTGLATYIFWGLTPVFWKQLEHVPSFEILCHRIVWSVFFLALLIVIQRRHGEVAELLSRPRTVLILLATSTIISLNWGTYIWAVNSERILETSLGYYINPLVSVLIGFIFFRERMSRAQVIAVCLAFAGVANLALHYGRLPAASLILAFTFAIYGAVRKKADAKPIPGLLVETAVISVPVGIYLIYLGEGGAFTNLSVSTDMLLIAGGLVTSMPLLGFAFTVKRLRLITVGFLQYTAPTVSFLLGVFVYHEPFTAAHKVTFICIWSGLLLYSLDSIRGRRTTPRT